MELAFSKNLIVFAPSEALNPLSQPLSNHRLRLPHPLPPAPRTNVLALSSSNQAPKLPKAQQDPPPSTAPADAIGVREPHAFSKLPAQVPWDSPTVITTMLSYYGILHIPLGLGGLSILAQFLHEEELDTQIKAVSLVFLQLSELAGSIWLVQSSLNQDEPSSQIFNFNFGEIQGKRGWFLTSVLGLATLLLLMGTTAAFIGNLFHAQSGDDFSALKDLLSGNAISRGSTFLVYCLLTPCLEEFIYRGFLLQSLATYIRWPCAIVVSALIFALGHFNLTGSPALFLIGCILGLAYTWSGNLAASLVIHSTYNAIVLLTAMSHWNLPLV